MEQAIAWAAEYLRNSLEYEFFRNIEDARLAAENMTVLSGKEWSVKADEHRFWAVEVARND